MKILIFCICCFLIQTSTLAKVKLPDILSDNMVLQQQTQVKLWGWSNPNVQIIVTPSWDNNLYSVMSDNDGKWEVVIKTPQASYNPYCIRIFDGEITQLSNILIGEVWFCSGQSNMEMPLGGFWNCPIEGANETITTSNKWKGIRVATIERNGQLVPVENCIGSWKVSCPENTPYFTAVGFYFAMMMNTVLDIPIGIISCSWGGSTIEGWLPRDIVEQYDDINLVSDIREGGGHGWWHHMSPILMYNGMIKPLQNYTIRGFLWYQGESNVGKHKTYTERLKTMVEVWRNGWGLGEIPFYYVEIAPYGSRKNYLSALLREAQYNAQHIIPNSVMVSTNDLVEDYEKDNIHPKNKRSIGNRLAYVALNKTYNIGGIEYLGPMYKSMELKDEYVILSFMHANEGFYRQNDLRGFEIAGEDRVFYPAKAELYNEMKIRVYSDKVMKPVAVRYGFRDYLPGNVSNIRGLPLYPFRTDNWE